MFSGKQPNTYMHFFFFFVNSFGKLEVANLVAQWCRCGYQSFCQPEMYCYFPLRMSCFMP